MTSCVTYRALGDDLAIADNEVALASSCAPASLFTHFIFIFALSFRKISVQIYRSLNVFNSWFTKLRSSRECSTKFSCRSEGNKQRARSSIRLFADTVTLSNSYIGFQYVIHYLINLNFVSYKDTVCQSMDDDVGLLAISLSHFMKKRINIGRRR